jgi:hypothetical protein
MNTDAVRSANAVRPIVSNIQVGACAHQASARRSTTKESQCLLACGKAGVGGSPSNYAVNATHSAVTARAKGSTHRAVGRARYRGRWTD